MQCDDQRQLAAIMMTDVVGYAALTQRDEGHAMRLLDTYRRIVRESLAMGAGREVKTMGDGFLVEFASALESVRCAIEIQTRLHEHNETAPAQDRILVRIGLHLGEVVRRGGDVFGDGVNIASRIEPLAEPGGICLSEDLARIVKGRLDLPIVRVGRGELKNIQAPVEICHIILPWQGGLAPLLRRLLFRLGLRQVMHRPAVVVPTLTLAVIGLFVAILRLTLGTQPALVAEGVPGAATPLVEPRPRPARTSVVVLPFVNMSPEADDEYLSDGITEEIINTLAQADVLRVVSRTSAFAFKGRNEDIRTIAQELNVGTLVEGSVRRSGDRLRVTAQVINADDGLHLWSDTYERSIEDVFAIQDEIALSIAQTVVAEVGDSAPDLERRHYTGDLEAYNDYLRGQSRARKLDAESLRQAIGFYNQAIERDPKFAQAYAGLADALFLLGASGTSRPADVFPKAAEAVKTALELDDTLADAHAVAGTIRACWEWDWEGAMREVERAVELNPSHAVARERHAYALAFEGRMTEALAEMERVLQLDPLGLPLHLGACHLFRVAKDYDRVIELSSEVLELYPESQLAYVLLGEAYAAQGHLDDAESAFGRAGKVTGIRTSDIPSLAWIYMKLGKEDEARVILDTIKAQAEVAYVMPTAVAACYAALGDNDSAFEWLDKAYDEHDMGLLFIRTWPCFEGIQDDPRLIELLHRMGLDDVGRIAALQ